MMIVALASLAQASEVGTLKKFGVGASVGYPVSATVKYFFNEQFAGAAYVGVWYVGGLDTRLEIEHHFLEPWQWGFGNLGFYWDAGLQFDVYPAGVYYGGQTSVGVGVYGGAAAYLRFNDVPAEVFAGGDVGVQFVTYDTYQALPSPVLPLGHANAGGRWFF